MHLTHIFSVACVIGSCPVPPRSPTIWPLASVTYGLTAEDEDQLPTLISSMGLPLATPLLQKNACGKPSRYICRPGEVTELEKSVVAL